MISAMREIEDYEMEADAAPGVAPLQTGRGGHGTPGHDEVVPVHRDVGREGDFFRQALNRLDAVTILCAGHAG